MQYIPDNIKTIEIIGGLSFDYKDKRLSNGDVIYSSDNDVNMPEKIPIELKVIKINTTGLWTYIFNKYISFDLYNEHFTIFKEKINKLNSNIVIEEF